mgnify:CR=1 FL=1
MTNTLVEQYLFMTQQIEQNVCLNEIESLLQELSVSDFSNYAKKFSLIEKALKQYGVSVEKIKAFSFKLRDKVKIMFDKGMTPEQASEQIVNDLKDEAIATAKHLASKYNEVTLPSKIYLGLCMFIVVVMINSLIGSILIPIAGDKAFSILAIVVAPMVEEAAKNYFIGQGLPWVGTGIVFGLELLQYLMILMIQGLKVGKIIILRIASLLMHFGTTFVQKKIIDSAVNDSGDDYNNKRFIAWTVGVGIHATWNLFAIIYNKEIIGWAST